LHLIAKEAFVLNGRGNTKSFIEEALEGKHSKLLDELEGFFRVFYSSRFKHQKPKGFVA